MRNLDWNYFLIAALAALFFIPFLGNAHLFDWDEINFAECAREMLVTGDYLRPQINYEPFWEKPPLFIWFQVLSMKLFGINEFAARFPNAICGIATLLVVYHLGKKWYDKTFGWLWALAYFGSILPHLYFKSGIIDPWFNLLIFLSLIFLIKTEQPKLAQTANFQTSNLKNYPLSIFIAGAFSGLAILTKGPVGFLIVALTWFFKLLIFRELSWFRIKQFAVLSATALVVALSWFGVEIAKNGTWFVSEFINYTIRLAKTEDAGHGGFVGYHFVVLLVGCFPASIFALRALVRRYNFFGELVDYTRWMKVLFWVVLILFSVVQSKIVHYSSMCYLPLTFLSAITLKSILAENIGWQKTKAAIVGLGVLMGLIVFAIPFVGQNIALLKPLFKNDLFALKNLEAQVNWTGGEATAGVFLILMLIAFNFITKRSGILRGSVLLFLGVALFVQLSLFFLVNKIEAYSQRAALDFYEGLQQEDSYVSTYGFKSYAHLFYSRMNKPAKHKQKEDAQILSERTPIREDSFVHGTPSGRVEMGRQIGKPSYLVAKIMDKPTLDSLPNLQYLYEKNGFVFYKKR